MKSIHGWYNKLFWNMGVIAILEKPYLLTPHTHKKWKHINKHLIFPLAHYSSLCNFYPSFNHRSIKFGNRSIKFQTLKAHIWSRAIFFLNITGHRYVKMTSRYLENSYLIKLVRHKFKNFKRKISKSNLFKTAEFDLNTSLCTPSWTSIDAYAFTFTCTFF